MSIQSQPLPKNSPVRILALGDSYTIGESVAEDQRWPILLVKALENRGLSCEVPNIIAVTGWRTDQLKDAITKQRPPSDYHLVFLLIGVNNQYQGKSIGDYENEFSELVDMAIQHARLGKRGVTVLSIPDYGFTPFGAEKRNEISEDIDAFNAVNERVARSKGVGYVGITDISRRGLDEPELVAADGLHPSARMYQLWVQRILDEVIPQ